MDIYTLLVITHIFGTVLGVGGATFVEIFLNKSLRDGIVDPTEKSFLQTSFSIVRWGLIISLFSGFGFLLLYKLTDQAFRLYDPILWSKLTIILIIAINALLLQAHKISLYWGSALSFVSWYFVLVLGIFLRGHSLDYSFSAIMVIYIFSVVVGALALEFIRRKIQKKYSEKV